MLLNKQEFPCRILDASPGGMSIVAPVRGELKEKVVFYLDDLGRIEGEIVRATMDGFAVVLQLPQNKRERLADLLTWLVNQQQLDLPLGRRHTRITPRAKTTKITLPSGSIVPAQIIDVSLSGVGLKLSTIVAMGHRVVVGQRVGKVVRQLPSGFAVEFSRLIPIEEFDDAIIL